MAKLLIVGVVAICLYGIFLAPALGRNWEGPLGSRIRRVNCAMGRHERSRRKVKKVEGGYTSLCKYCGVALARGHGSRHWSTDTAAIIAPPANSGLQSDDLAEDGAPRG